MQVIEQQYRPDAGQSPSDEHDREAVLRTWWQFAEQANWGVARGDLASLTISRSNPAYAAMHGYAPQELQFCREDRLWAPESRVLLPEIQRAVLRGERRTFECIRLRKDGSTFMAEVEIAAVDTGERADYICMIRDITLRMQERTAIERLSNCHAVPSQCSQAVIRSGTENELFARACRDAVQFGDRLECVECESPQKAAAYCGECELAREAIHGGRQHLAQVKLEQANVRLARLSAQLIEIQEQERKSLAREMHDELGQRLTLLKIGIHRMREFLGEPRAVAIWERADAEVNALIGEIRAMSGSLRPQCLDYLGLEAAVRQLLEAQFAHAGIDCVFEYAGLPGRIPAPIDITAYRIVQEGATNIVKHARASQVVVEINGGERGDEMEVVVRDNGKGFEPGGVKAAQSSGMGRGLCGLRERIDLLGGRISLESALGAGTRLVCVLPLKGAVNGKN